MRCWSIKGNAVPPRMRVDMVPVAATLRNFMIASLFSLECYVNRFRSMGTNANAEVMWR